MTVEIPGELLHFVETLVSRGTFQSETEVVGAGLRLLQERERKLEELRKEIVPALERLDRGEGIELDDESLDDFFEEIKSRDGRHGGSQTP